MRFQPLPPSETPHAAPDNPFLAPPNGRARPAPAVVIQGVGGSVRPFVLFLSRVPGCVFGSCWRGDCCLGTRHRVFRVFAVGWAVPAPVVPGRPRFWSKVVYPWRIADSWSVLASSAVL